MGDASRQNPVVGLNYFMTRREVLESLKASRYFNTADDIALWREAFRLYNEATGVGLKTKDGCSKCFAAVKEWLLEEDRK
jgi:hypothetical protein